MYGKCVEGLCVCAGVLSASLAMGQTFTPLGLIDATTPNASGYALGVSPDGTYVVGHTTATFSAAETIHAFLWSEAGGMKDLGLSAVNEFGDHEASSARDVSANGSLVVGTIGVVDTNESLFFYAENGERWENALTSPTGFAMGNNVDMNGRVIKAVSPNGLRIAGQSRQVFSPFGLRPPSFLTSDISGNTNYFSNHFAGSSATFDQMASAEAISADGTLAVGGTYNGIPASVNEGLNQAVMYTQGDFDMVFLAGQPVGQSSWAYGMTPDKSVIVGQLGNGAFKWSSGTNFTSLGSASGLSGARALDVSADGSVIVGTHDTSPPVAFIWDAANGMRSLRDVLINDYGLGAQLTDWQLWSATAISDDGMTIVGYGDNTANGVGAEPFVITLVAAGCPCDWNGVDDVNFFDLLDFLDDWFQNNADFNGTNGTNFFDLLDFLDCWFAASAGNCPAS